MTEVSHNTNFKLVAFYTSNVVLNKSALISAGEGVVCCVCHMMILKGSFTSNLPTTCSCAPAAKEADPILGLRRNVASRLRGILPLCSALQRPVTGYWAQFWASQYERDMELLEGAQ